MVPYNYVFMMLILLSSFVRILYCYYFRNMGLTSVRQHMAGCHNCCVKISVRTYRYCRLRVCGFFLSVTRSGLQGAWSITHCSSTVTYHKSSWQYVAQSFSFLSPLLRSTWLASHLQYTPT